MLRRRNGRLGSISGWVAGVAVAALTLTACGGGTTTTTSTSSGGGGATSGGSSAGGATTLTLIASSAPTTLDPWTNQNAYQVLDATYDELIHVKADGTLVPWLATSWKFTDPKTLELKLQSGVKFTDGTVFDATAVKKNLEYGRDTKQGNGGQVFLKEITSVTAVDASTVKIVLSAPNTAFPYDLSQLSGYMVSPKSLASPDTLKTAPVGTGPYLLDTAATRTGLTYAYKRNPDYWAKSQNLFPYDTVIFKVIPDTTTAQNAARSGQADTLSLLSAGKTLTGFTTVSSLSGEFSGFTGFAVQDLNGKVAKPLADVRVRQALNYAIDRGQIIKTLFGGAATAVPSIPYQPSTAGFSQTIANYYTYDPAKAKQLLTEAGYPNGFDLPALSLPIADPLAQILPATCARLV